MKFIPACVCFYRRRTPICTCGHVLVKMRHKDTQKLSRQHTQVAVFEGIHTLKNTCIHYRYTHIYECV